MIKEDYVSFEVASLLATSGFPALVCHKHYACGDGVWIGDFDKPTPDFKCGELVENPCCLPTDGSEIDAPTLQMALKWLDEKGISISAVPFDVMQRVSDKIVRFMANVFVRHPDYLDNLIIGVFDSRQEATNAAILYVLNFLESLTIYSSQNP